MSIPRQIVVGTAGHIDHGKSRLVQALTGTDPDRFREEKERGITIDLGFAHMSLEDGTRVGFVDVPGHERFVKNMLAGVGGIDLVLLVIAADESIKPQTREHFDICRLLRVSRGIVVLTKIDLVEPDLVDLVRLEARDFTAGSFLEGAPVIAVSSETGAGLDSLVEALTQVAADAPVRSAAAPARLPIDRAFSMKGFGTVVTGTLIAGCLREGDEVAILPKGARARVRGLEVHKEATRMALPGQRTAVNLQGIEVGAIARGDVLAAPGFLEPTSLLDVELESLETAPGPIRDLTRLRYHQGAVEVLTRVKLLGGEPLSPGGRAFAQLRLERPVVALPGDRFILRRYSPTVTIGGGIVLHNKPPKLKGRATGARERFLRLADPDPAVAMRVLVSEAGVAGIDVAALRSRTGLEPDVCAGHLESAVREGEVMALPCKPRKYLSASAHATLVGRVFSALEEFHGREPLREGLPREEVRTRLFHDSHPEVFRCLLADLVSRGKVRMEKDRVALASHRVDLAPREAEFLEKMEAAFATAGTNPPSLQDVISSLGADPGQGEKLFHLLMARGRLVRIPDSRVFHVEAIEDLKRRLWTKRAESPTIDISEFKEMCGTTRRNAIPLLEHLDQLQITRREGNQRFILPPPDSRGSGPTN